MECEQPNSSLYTFTGNLLLHGKTIPLGPNQVTVFPLVFHLRLSKRGLQCLHQRRHKA